MNSDFSIALPSREKILTREWLSVVPIIISDREFYVAILKNILLIFYPPWQMTWHFLLKIYLI